MDSLQLLKAKSIVDLGKGKARSVEERREAAIQLAALMLDAARQTQTRNEKEIQGQLSRMMHDSVGKVFTTSMTDQCFRSKNSSRVADQLIYLMDKMGIPKFLSWGKRLQLKLFKIFGKPFASLLVPLTKHMLRKDTSAVILPGEPEKLSKHMEIRRKEGVRINLNHLGEAILGEEEAKHRLGIYLHDLSSPEVEYISVKISTISSQLNLLSWEDTLSILASRLKRLYRMAQQHEYVLPNGKRVPKFVNLDMEEYRDLNLTVDLFRRVLDEEEFLHYSAGIVLQSYLPDSHLIQQELTAWAMKRLASGGAPIKIRIVKGANLAMEQVEASIRGWPQAPYTCKSDVDANFKKMVTYGCIPEHAKAARLGIGSHNLFDIAYALLLRAENNVEPFVCFEMLEGMADHIRRIVQTLSGDMLLYCPAATKEEFQNAVAYLVRRLDENTAPENFLRHVFGMVPGTKEWESQAALFSRSCEASQTVSALPRRQQNRYEEPVKCNLNSAFQNDPDTDWSLPQNRKWAEGIVREWSQKRFNPVPLIIGDKIILPNEHFGKGEDPSKPGQELYRYALASSEDVEEALSLAQKAQKNWSEKSFGERARILADAANCMRRHRSSLIGVMMADTGKTVPEADVEISEAIDFIEYYSRNLEEIGSLQDIGWTAKGTILVAPPWNFPCSIPTGGIIAALAAGNAVIFKPAAEAVLVGWYLANIFWEAGIGKDILQFINGEDETIGSQLVKDPRISAVVLTGATETAKLLLKLRPGLDLIAETGGKNAMILTNLSDRDLAIKDIIQSAFGHAGQKCSACSLVVCEGEVYDDPHFRQQLRDAAASLRVGSTWNLSTRINPLIRQPNPGLLQGLTTLEEGEEWLLKPKQDPKNPNLWSPGIKMGVKPGSFTHQTEFFGPVLGIMRADNLKHAVEIANGTPYGLTSGLQSLDEREQTYWKQHIEAGNCYINRGITGAVVQRQPFGGCKESSFGRGLKAGGPNYLMQLMQPMQIHLPEERDNPPEEVQKYTTILHGCNQEEQDLWQASVENYTFYWNHYFSKAHDPSQIVGQDNHLCYVPQKKMLLRINDHDSLIDVMRVMAACRIVDAPLEISLSQKNNQRLCKMTQDLSNKFKINIEEEQAFIDRVMNGQAQRVRLLTPPSAALQQALAAAASNVILAPVLANGRIELLNYIRELSLSIDYHRYGNLGAREAEMRDSLVDQCCSPVCCLMKKNEEEAECF